MNKNQDLREKIDYNLLLNYMSHVSTLEKERYELHILYEALDQQHKRLNRENRKVRQKLVMKPNHEFVAGSAVLAVVTAIIGFIVLIFLRIAMLIAFSIRWKSGRQLVPYFSCCSH